VILSAESETALRPSHGRRRFLPIARVASVTVLIWQAAHGVGGAVLEGSAVRTPAPQPTAVRLAQNVWPSSARRPKKAHPNPPICGGFGGSGGPKDRIDKRKHRFGQTGRPLRSVCRAMLGAIAGPMLRSTERSLRSLADVVRRIGRLIRRSRAAPLTYYQKKKKKKINKKDPGFAGSCSRAYFDIGTVMRASTDGWRDSEQGDYDVNG